jgi:hypothetical protein
MVAIAAVVVAVMLLLKSKWLNISVFVVRESKGA